MDFTILRPLLKPNTTKIVLFIIDGIGGLPQKQDKQTELEVAKTPHLDALVKESICGLHQPVLPGITPGSGPGHLGVFGYNPIKYQVGRGVLSALGINFDLGPHDVAARGNFCTIDKQGLVQDRRAGRIPTKKNIELCSELKTIPLPNVDLFVRPVKEHRFLLVLRNEQLEGNLADTDPQELGKPPLEPQALTTEAGLTAQVVDQFIDQARHKLEPHYPANMILLRGFSKKPKWPTFQQSFGLKSAAIAAYPMYKGLARLLGMDVLQTEDTLEQRIHTMKTNWDTYDFFFLHEKKTDSSGEDGDFQRKVQAIEEVDQHIPQILDLEPDVVIITGDHSTPAELKYHSWHPVPTLLWSKVCRPDAVTSFTEKACITGGLGPRFPAEDLMPLALANAFRLEKFGA